MHIYVVNISLYATFGYNIFRYLTYICAIWSFCGIFRFQCTDL